MSDEFLDGLSVEQRTVGWTRALSQEEPPPVRVGVRDGAVIGFCIMALPSRDEDTSDEYAEVAALNVSPDEWRSGVGGALMRDALERFRREGFAVASLWVADGNDRAVEFYKQLGFTFDGASIVDEPTGVRELRMQLPLIDA